MSDKFCCERFANDATSHDEFVAGGFMYPKEVHPFSQFEIDEDGKSWNINGCCGGGCFVVTDMLFCPYCGKRLIEESEADAPK